MERCLNYAGLGAVESGGSECLDSVLPAVSEPFLFSKNHFWHNAIYNPDLVTYFLLPQKFTNIKSIAQLFGSLE